MRTTLLEYREMLKCLFANRLQLHRSAIFSLTLSSYATLAFVTLSKTHLSRKVSSNNTAGTVRLVVARWNRCNVEID